MSQTVRSKGGKHVDINIQNNLSQQKPLPSGLTNFSPMNSGNPTQSLNKNAPSSRSRGDIIRSRGEARGSDFRLTAEKMMKNNAKEYLPVMERNPSRDRVLNSIGQSGLPPRGREMGVR